MRLNALEKETILLKPQANAISETDMVLDSKSLLALIMRIAE